MLISIVNTRGVILPGAQATVMDLRDPKARPQPILWDPEMGKFRMDTENWSEGRYLLQIACEEYESLEQEISWKEGQKVIEPIILGKPGCRIWQMGDRKIPIDSPVETLLVAPKVETLEEGKAGEWDARPLEKWVQPSGDGEQGEPLSRSLHRVELPREIDARQSLKKDIEMAGFEVFALNISGDAQNPITVLDRAIFCFEDSVSDKDIQSLLNQNGFDLLEQIRKDLHKQKIVRCQYREMLSWEMMDKIGEIQGFAGAKWVSISHIVNAKDTAHTSGDELFALQWSLHLANVPDAWSLLYGKEATDAYGSADVIVDVFDSGIQSNIAVNMPFSRAIHPDFNVNVQGGSLEGIDGNLIANSHKIYHLYDFSRKAPSLLMSPNNDRPKSAHGVEVAGIVGAASSPDPSLPLAGVPGNDGIAGVSPNVRLMGSQWGSNMPNNNWYDAWGFLAGFNGGWNGTYAGTQSFPAAFNSPQNLGPGFSISNHSHSWPNNQGIPALAISFAPGSPESDLIDCFVSFGRNRRGAFMIFASGNDDENINAHTTIAQHEKMIISAGSSIGPLGFEERTSYANFGSVVPPGGFSGPQEYAEIDICAPTNHHGAGTNGLDNPSHYYHQPMTNFGVFTTALVGRPGAVDAVAAGGVVATSPTLPVVNGAIFRVGDPILIGNDGGTRETAVVYSIAGNVLTLVDPLSKAYAGGQQVLVNSLANSPYNNAAADTLNGAVVAGGMTITLNNIAGFVVGSAVRIGNMPVYPANNNCETGFIESILGNMITLRDPLRFGHGNGEPVICGTANITDSFSGTSAAAPFASGVYALVVSANPKLSFWEARDLIKRNAEKIDLRLQSPNPGVLNVQWVDLAGNAIVDGNGLLQQQVAPIAVVGAQHFTDPHRTQVELSTVAGLSTGQAVLFGAENTVLAFPAGNQIQMSNVNGYFVGQQVEVNAGPTSSVVYRPVIGQNRVVVGNVNGFRVGHQIQISDGVNTEVRTISGIVNGPGAVPVSGMTETLFLQFPPANLVNSNMTVAAPIGSATVQVANGGLFLVGQKIVLKKAGVAREQKIITAIAGNVLTLSTVTTVAYGIGDIVERGGLEFNYPITAQITLANRVTRTITNVNPGTNTITLNAAINPVLYPLGGGNPAVVVRSLNAELAVIKSIDAASKKITTKRLVSLPAAGSFAIGGRSPHYSYALGSGRVDAYASVKEALSFNHDMRDLMVRNFMADDGKAATDPAENPIDSPDIWAINQAPLAGNVAHGAPNTPATITDSGASVHQKPLRSAANVDMYMRIYNRGTQNSFDYSAHVYMGLKDEDIDDSILVDDYIDGPTTITPYSYIPFSTQDTLSAGSTFNLNNSGPGVHPGSRVLANYNSSPAAYGGTNTFLPLVPAGNGLMYIANLSQADRPRLPYGYTVVRTTSANIATDTVLNLEHTRGLSNGQQILVGRPGDAGYELATIAADPTISTVTLAAGLANGHPNGTLIIRLENVNSLLNGAHAAGAAADKYSTLTVDSAADFKLGNYIVTGALPSAANNKFHRIVRIIRDTATGTENLVVEPKLGAALADNTLITQVGGRLGTFVLGEVTPHDGILDGNTPADNNNISYKRVNFEHDVLFRETDGVAPLRSQIQVASDGSTLNTPFRVFVQDLDQFNTEKVILTLTRKMVNGDYQSETFYYKTSVPVGWTLTPNTAGWLTMNAPLLTATNLAAAGNQTDVYFDGTFDADNTVESFSITVNVEGNDPHPLGARDFITTRTHTAQIFQVANLPDPNDPDLQDATGMPALVGTQTMHVFADMADLEQSQAQAFGPVNSTQFRLTSSFDTTSTPGAIVNAYAAVDGIVFIQRNLIDNTINLVLKPIKQAEIGFNKVKYFIYRGLREDDIINMGAPLEMKVNGTAYPEANFVDYVNKTNDELNPGVPVPLTALGWDPTNQSPEDVLDDFFFNSSAVRQLPVVKRGMVLARFNNPLIGFEIVLAEGNYPITLANIRQASYTLDVSAIANADDRAAKREEILNYIDPAAYYGMHYLSGILRSLLPTTIDTEKLTKTDLYTDFVSKFWTKNVLYLDIRNDNGYSYNYYGNYTQVTGSDLGKAIKLGYIPPSQQALITSKFETQEWPIIIYNNESTPEDNPENMSAVYFQLSTADNGDPIAFFEYGNAVSSTTENNYATSADLLETNIVTAIDAGTNKITVSGDTSALSVGSLFYLIDCDHGPANTQYRIANIVAGLGTTDLIVEAGTLDYNPASGPALGLVHYQNWSKVVIVSHPNEPTVLDPNKKVNVASMVKLRYFRQMHESGKPVIAIDQANKRITLAGLVPRQLKEGDKLIWSDATGTANNGTYTIAANGVLQIGIDTRVEVLEAIPDAFVGGGVDGKVKVKPTKVPAIGHYTDHKFGSLNSMMRRFKITNLVVNSAVQSTITIAGDYRHILSNNIQLSIVDASVVTNNGNYAFASSPTLNMAGDTEIAITTLSALTNSISVSPDEDLISVVALPWRSNDPTQWIAGLDLRYLDARKQLLDEAGNPRDGFAYMGQTGVAVEQDRMVFHMTPLDFFRVPQENFSPAVVNMAGGTSLQSSYWKIMQGQNQALKINSTLLSLSGGAQIIPVFDFVDVADDAQNDDPAKSNFLSLCITRDEFHRLKYAADMDLNGLHDLFLVLRNEQAFTDDNGVDYKKFLVAVSGYARKQDGSLVAHESYPAVPVAVYAPKQDAVIFTSEDFAVIENTETELLSYEEALKDDPKVAPIVALNPSMGTFITDFTNDLAALDHNYLAIQALVAAKGLVLWNAALADIDAGGGNPYDDRILYWTRLMARNVIREHATCKLQFVRRNKLLQLFDDWSRGYLSVDFSGAPIGAKKVLVLGFDPFGLGTNIRSSNPAGSIALSLHGETLTNGGNQAYIQSMVVPVRFKDFDRGVIERIVRPYLSGVDKVDAIFTVNRDNVDYFNAERFAARYREPDASDNDNKRGGFAMYRKYKASNDSFKVSLGWNLPNFLESTLPIALMSTTLGNTRPSGSNLQIVVPNQTWTGKLSGSDVSNFFVWDPDSGSYSPANVEVAPSANVRPREGSGGNYLSNEIFYRVASAREMLPAPKAKSGHLHVPLIQGPTEDFSQTETNVVVQNARTIITDAIPGL